MSGDAPRQLPLALPHAPEHGLDSFIVAPSNSAAFTLITRWPDWPSPIVVLSGPLGSGKTHLAHIWAERAGARWLTSADLAAYDAGGLQNQTGLVVDDADRAGFPEQALFHLLNSVVETRSTLLLTVRSPSSDRAVSLPDLRSRLRLATPATLEPPGDDLLRQVLVKLFADRQLSVDKPLVDYLLARMERSLSAAVELVDRLDKAALAGGRRITRPLAAEVLAGHGEGVFPDR